ncbi:ABC transporter permease [Aerococcaceae bacterium DSM 111021]|nr:ABC transporter permease [Aerococcaceae bacterium DSM 111021]
MEHIQQNSSLTKGWSLIYQQMQRQWTYKIALWVLGLPLHIIFFVIQLIRFTKYKSQPAAERISDDEKTVLRQKLIEEEQNKQAYFKQSVSAEQTEKRVNQRLNHYVQSLIIENNDMSERIHLSDIFADWTMTPVGFITSIILAWPMYILMIVYRMPILRYIVERLFLMVFVIFGVTWIVFTLLHFSPSDPAQNILGVQATPEQIQNFNVLHGLDDSYWVQLFRTLKGIVTFDLGFTYVGNELVVDALLRRFPITLQVTFFSLAISLAIAIPAGIYAAVKVNSLFDQFFMFLALIGLSIPTFWLGLIFILNFSIRNRWLPATFNPENPWSLLMPAVVLGTSLAASVARMTRASTLEVIHEDYLLTARSKGMSNWRIVWRHIIPNALIPVVTVVGLQFGGMLGGSAVTEQVFNINGVGSYIVEKQFVPDIPAVLGGVIYIAIIVSLVNLVVDLLYAILDPRIRTTLKN